MDPVVNTTYSFTATHDAFLKLSTDLRNLLNVLHAFVVALSLYIFISLVIYEKRLGSCERGPGNSESKAYGRILRALCIVNSVLSTCNGAMNLIFFNTFLYSSVGCNVMRNLEVTFLTMMNGSVYLFLWLRQYFVYSSLDIERAISKRLAKLVSWSSLTLMFVLFCTSNSLIICCRRYSYSRTITNCVNVSTDVVRAALSYMWLMGSLVMHVLLLLMFVYPLVKLNKLRHRLLNPATSELSNHMMALVRRCFFVSLTCVLSDVIVMTLTHYVLTGPSKSQLRHLLYNANVLLNAAAVVASFKEWKEMLFPCVRNSA